MKGVSMAILGVPSRRFGSVRTATVNSRMPSRLRKKISRPLGDQAGCIPPSFETMPLNQSVGYAALTSADRRRPGSSRLARVVTLGRVSSIPDGHLSQCDLLFGLSDDDRRRGVPR
jgi:hypothetical protein